MTKREKLEIIYDAMHAYFMQMSFAHLTHEAKNICRTENTYKYTQKIDEVLMEIQEAIEKEQNLEKPIDKQKKTVI